MKSGSIFMCVLFLVSKNSCIDPGIPFTSTARWNRFGRRTIFCIWLCRKSVECCYLLRSNIKCQYNFFAWDLFIHSYIGEINSRYLSSTQPVSAKLCGLLTKFAYLRLSLVFASMGHALAQGLFTFYESMPKMTR